MDEKILKLLQTWPKRNIQGVYCASKAEAAEKILEMIPVSASVGLCGSQTLEQVGLIKLLEARGQKVFNQYKPSLSQEERLEIRNQGASADYFLASANAISQDGKLVFFSAFGHRIAGIANARNVIVVCGVNKITPTLDAAFKRSREYVTPLNCQRLNWPSPCLKDGVCHEDICFFPEHKRMCCQVLVIEAEVNTQRLKVILVGEPLGF